MLRDLRYVWLGQLHLELIHEEEAITERERKCELEMDRLRDQVAQLQFLHTQHRQQMTQRVRLCLMHWSFG